jgi:hypothetical protein
MSKASNPFAVQTPEAISAEDVIFLFVDVFTEFYNVLKPGHTFLHGPRGSGKSMMFRYMQPDCQLLVKKVPLDSIEYLSVYVSVKSTDLSLTELARLENKHANMLINEHLMIVNIAAKTLHTLTELDNPEPTHVAAVRSFYTETFRRLLENSGWDKPLPELTDSDTVQSIFSKMTDACEHVHRTVINYLKRLPFSDQSRSLFNYDGPLCGYLDFLLPLIQGLRKLQFVPKGPVFLLIDDADNLNDTQQTILNTWVSYRASADISLKISTQMNYKNWRTVSGTTIDTPHDFSEVRISDIYTSSKNKYRDRIYDIVRRRLENADIKVAPETFFPTDSEQEAAIEGFREKIRERYSREGRGNRLSDDVTRYARPEYIASLKGTSKSASTYSYSGFDQLVHISSGIIRHFLEAASLMYGEMQSRNPTGSVTCIEPSVQNKVVRSLADQFLFSEFEKLETDQGSESATRNTVRKLRNLVTALGRSFEQILISNLTERRVFSIAFSDPPDDEIMEVLSLGLRYGYFHESTIGLKDGTGRTRLYVLSRRLAPHFSLDPTSFAGYKFVTTDVIHEAMRNPDSLVGRVRRHGFEDVFKPTPQMDLFRSS